MNSAMPYAKGWNDTRPKPSGKWEARWADETGQARGKCFLTRAQAAKYALDMALGIVNAAVGLAVPNKKIQEAADAFLDKYTDAGTLTIYERHLNDFLEAFPAVQITGQLTKDLIIRYNSLLADGGHNPGGRRHILKTVKTFTNFCREKNWLGVDPFFKFQLPKSDFEGRALTPDEFNKMIAIDPRFDVDGHINRAIRFGNPTMLRISQVWGLTPRDFREPDQMRIKGIKGQESVWITLHPSALDVIRELLIDRAPDQRFFDKWPTVDSMRQSIRKKAYRVGLDGTRFHDAGKVSRVTELDAAGFGLGELAELSNTTKATLAKHYIKADRRRAFQRYQTYGGPTKLPNTAENTQQAPMVPTTAGVQNDASL